MVGILEMVGSQGMDWVNFGKATKVSEEKQGRSCFHSGIRTWDFSNNSICAARPYGGVTFCEYFI